MKLKFTFCFSWFLLFGVVLSGARAAAQTIAYRQTNLASNLPNVANNIAPGLVHPWGIAFLSNQPFFIADNTGGRVTSLDATGLGVSPGGFIVSNSAGIGFDSPTGIVADENSFFGGPSLVKPFILVTDQGTVFTWGPDARGDLPQQATLVVDNSSQGAVYKGVAILNSSLTAPALAITDFHRGFIETFLPGFPPVALPGSFTDPNLPAGYAPFGIQVIGSQVFVTYAVQDAAKHDPIIGSGNGIVDIFDMDGNFVRRFTTGGALNAPWGITQASANFGPFSNDILIGNTGDGNINAFDPTTGQFVGKLLDGDGFTLAEVGLHGLAFRADGFGDRNTLYFTSQFDNENDGLFGAITTGLVTVVRVFTPDPTVNTTVTITANVAAGLGNAGAPTGTVTFLDGANLLGTAPLVNDSATLDTIFTDIGIHGITAKYSGDGVFLPSSERIPLQVAGLATMLVLTSPASATPGSTVVLTATITSNQGIPTGQIVFHDGRASLGAAALDATGVANLRINTLPAGVHSLTASYAGDERFGASESAASTISIANADFSLGATPPSATVVAGQSAQFMLTVTPVSGFANSVTFSCPQITGISCVFNPATIAPSNEAASTSLTVTTSTSVPQFGLLPLDLVGPGALAALALCGTSLGILIWLSPQFPIGRISLRPNFRTALLIVTLGLLIGGCGGHAGGGQPNRGTASIVITAQSGTISHTTTVRVSVQ